MARPGVTIPIYGDTRPLMRDIKRATSTPLKLPKLDDKPIRAPLGRIRGDLGEFEKSLEASNARVLAFGASAGAIYAVGAAFRQLDQSTKGLNGGPRKHSHLPSQIMTHLQSFASEDQKGDVNRALNAINAALNEQEKKVLAPIQKILNKKTDITEQDLKTISEFVFGENSKKL